MKTQRGSPLEDQHLTPPLACHNGSNLYFWMFLLLQRSDLEPFLARVGCLLALLGLTYTTPPYKLLPEKPFDSLSLHASLILLSSKEARLVEASETPANRTKGLSKSLEWGAKQKGFSTSHFSREKGRHKSCLEWVLCAAFSQDIFPPGSHFVGYLCVLVGAEG